MDSTPIEEAKVSDNGMENQDPQALAEGILKRRIVALIDTVSFVLFSYVAQVTTLKL